MKAQELLRAIVESIVDEPKKVEIERTVDEMGVLLTLRVGEGDRGAVIGRQGNTAKAIRTLIRIAGIKNNARINIKIDVPDMPKRPDRPGRTDKKPFRVGGEKLDEL